MERIIFILGTILKRFLIIVFPLLLLLNWGYQATFESQYELLLNKIHTRQREVIAIIDYHLNNTFETLFNDLNLIKNSNEFQDYLTDPSVDNYDSMLQMFVRVAKSKSSFLQIRFLSPKGIEVARVNQKEENIEIVSQENLQDKSDRYYVKTLRSLSEPSLYVSDFDLNIENDSMVIPYEPIVRFGTTVFIEGQNTGSIIINYDGISLLNILEKYDSQSYNFINLGLLDKNHLLSLNILNGQSRSFIDSLLYPVGEDEEQYKIIRENINNNDSGSFILDNDYFYFNRIIDDLIPLEFEESSGPWILISSFNIPSVLQAEENLILKYPIIRFLFLFLVSLFSLIIIIISFLKEDEHLFLLASGYISEYTHDGVIITDRKRRVIYCNKVFEYTFGYSFDQIKGVKPKVFLEGVSNIDLSQGDREELLWAGNIWDRSASNIFILKFLQVKAVVNKRKKPAYYIGIYSEAKPKMLGTSPGQKGALILKYLDDQLLSFIDPLFNAQFEISRKYVIITIKIFDFSNLKNILTESEESKFVSIVSNGFESILSGGGLITAPSSTLFVLAIPFTETQKSINEIMQQIDGAISAVRFTSSADTKIDYLSGIAISEDHGIKASEIINQSFIALEALIKFRKTKYLVYDQKYL